VDPSGGSGSTELQPEYDHFTNGVLMSARVCACAQTTQPSSDTLAS